MRTGDKNFLQDYPLNNTLDQLKHFTSIVADTGDFESFIKYKPDDITTNPTLILQAIKSPKYKNLINNAIISASNKNLSEDDLIIEICDYITVFIGYKLLDFLPQYGRISTEIDANLSFDTDKTIIKARKLISMYNKLGIPNNKILIKLASTWESIQACKILENEGINCNMTLVFGLHQAIACADSGATLISPFVGRILDWFKNTTGNSFYTIDTDPGVSSVRNIYKYFKTFGYNTIIMAASFRNIDQIIGLAGCDKLTISPKLLDELYNSFNIIDRVLFPSYNDDSLSKIVINEAEFRWMHNENQMATDKLSEGIRIFNNDLVKLKDYIKCLL